MLFNRVSTPLTAATLTPRTRRRAAYWVVIALLSGVVTFQGAYFDPNDVALPRPERARPEPVAAPHLDDLPQTTAIAPELIALELGGQTATLNHPTHMRAAGMTWVKYQIKWEPGASGSDVAVRIEEAHQQHFKVLLSITGPPFPQEINYEAYVEYLTEAATLNPDAIEIWNEQNLSREWPAGEISGENYVNYMLRPAYDAIKNVNSDIMVISGALSPTGYFGGCQPEGCDDLPFLEGMMRAGGYYYMDCLGVHFNSGATSPYDTGGHPADGGDGHYTWYYRGTADLYSFMNLRPLCFTELGYVSPEGYGDIAGSFAWAENTSTAQHAQWLGETVDMAQADGNVRLIIIFNVDFDYYGPDDPQAGYAIIRPDGKCPACKTLTSALSS